MPVPSAVHDERRCRDERRRERNVASSSALMAAQHDPGQADAEANQRAVLETVGLVDADHAIDANLLGSSRAADTRIASAETSSDAAVDPAAVSSSTIDTVRPGLDVPAGCLRRLA